MAGRSDAGTAGALAKEAKPSKEAEAEAVYPSDLKLDEWHPTHHTPFVGLVNQNSGGKKGKHILHVCARSEPYKSCMFDIIAVVKGGDALRNFRDSLNEAKDKASQKNDNAFRPRIICGGGDGTASFALLILFKALEAESPADDKGNGFIWTDEEMEKYFPALVQMPLGTGNDLGGILGWGRKYPGYSAVPLAGQEAHAENLAQWFDLALSHTTPVVAFDVWGVMPPPGQDAVDLKICELASVRDCAEDAKHRQDYVMKPAGPVVPFLVLLYASFGFSAKVVARFQVVRHDSQFENLEEYFKIGASLFYKDDSDQTGKDLTGLTIETLPEDRPEPNGTHRYFPPRASAKNVDYRECGLLNINSYTGGAICGADRAPVLRRCCMCGSGRRPVLYGDGKADFYRQKLVKTIFKTGLRLQTDKRLGGTFKFEKAREGFRGLFFQYDGEARFVFHPRGEAWRMDFERVLTIPVVVAPHAVSKTQTSAGPVRFGFVGDTEAVARVRARISKWVHGKLAEDLNATAEEIRAAGIPVVEAPGTEC